MIEMVIAILIGSILTTIALSGISSAQAGYAVRGAKTTYESLHARARIQAIEMGESVTLNFEETGDSAWIEHAGDVLERISFVDEWNVDVSITGAPTSFTLCFTPRGFADPDCLSSGFALDFVRQADSARIVVLPTGQILQTP